MSKYSLQSVVEQFPGSSDSDVGEELLYVFLTHNPGIKRSSLTPQAVIDYFDKKPYNTYGSRRTCVQHSITANFLTCMELHSHRSYVLHLVVTGSMHVDVKISSKVPVSIGGIVVSCRIEAKAALQPNKIEIFIEVFGIGALLSSRYKLYFQKKSD